MKRIILFSFVLVLALAFIGCPNGVGATADVTFKATTSEATASRAVAYTLENGLIMGSYTLKIYKIEVGNSETDKQTPESV